MEIRPRFTLDRVLKNVTVEILKDELTGEYSVGWYRQENTEEIDTTHNIWYNKGCRKGEIDE